MTTRTLSIVVPVYFNAESLPELFAELTDLERELAQREFALELIFVDDGSKDDSLQELLKLKKKRPATKVISLSRNFGAVAASKTGLSFVSGDVFTILAADLQDPPQQILPMLEQWSKGHKFVVSARASRGDPPLTRLFARAYYQLVKRLVVKNYPKGGYDLMLMDKCMLPYMAGSTKNTNPNLYALWLGFEPAILYYERRKRRHGKSQWTFRKRLKFLVDTMTGFSVTPIRLLSAFGVVVAMLSFLYGCSVVISALFGTVEVAGFATLAALISFFGGLILVMLGGIAEYVWRVFVTVNNHPETVIDQTFL